MHLDKNNMQNKIAQIKEKQEEKELEQIVNLADKKIGWIVFWSLFLSIAAYIYTGRYKAFFIVLLCQMSIGFGIGLASEDPEEAFATALGYGFITWPIISLVDNISAVNRSRNRFKELS